MAKKRNVRRVKVPQMRVGQSRATAALRGAGGHKHPGLRGGTLRISKSRRLLDGSGKGR